MTFVYTKKLSRIRGLSIVNSTQHSLFASYVKFLHNEAARTIGISSGILMLMVLVRRD